MSKELIRFYDKFKTSIVPIEKVPKSLITIHATIRTKKIRDNVYQLLDVIEKPKPEEIMSYYSVMPSNVLTRDIFPYFHKAKKYFTNKKEIAVADALTLYVRDNKEVYGWKFNGLIFNTGLMSGLIKSQIYTALHHVDFKRETKSYLKQLLKKA